VHSILNLKNEKNHLSSYNYLKQLFYLKQSFQDRYSDVLNENRLITGNHFSILNTVMIFSLFLLIYWLWFMPFFVQDGTISFNLLGYKVGSYGFLDASTFFWFVTRKLIIIIFLSLWFITSPHWWRFAILSPLAIYSFQFWEAFQDVSELDALSNLKIFPLVLLNLILTLLISRFVKYRVKLILTYQEISQEMEKIIEELTTESSREITNTLEKIRKAKRKGKKYREQLKALEKELAAKLDLRNG
jgi:hypothetical protein